MFTFCKLYSCVHLPIDISIQCMLVEIKMYYAQIPCAIKLTLESKNVVCMNLDNCVERKESMLFCFNFTLWARWAGGASFLSMSLPEDPSHNPRKLAVGLTFYSIAVPVILVITIQCCWVLACQKQQNHQGSWTQFTGELYAKFWDNDGGEDKRVTIIYAPISVIHHPNNSTFGLSILQFSFNWSSPALGTLSSSFPSSLICVGQKNLIDVFGKSAGSSLKEA